ncbi:hypothetical protein F4680DRAFT_441847 [Xylaria scruposa]|nr:hypothetical protein F4680DRAFT_441847 [Xylaria scruposa]
MASAPTGMPGEMPADTPRPSKRHRSKSGSRSRSPSRTMTAEPSSSQTPAKVGPNQHTIDWLANKANRHDRALRQVHDDLEQHKEAIQKHGRSLDDLTTVVKHQSKQIDDHNAIASANHEMLTKLIRQDKGKEPATRAYAPRRRDSVTETQPGEQSNPFGASPYTRHTPNTPFPFSGHTKPNIGDPGPSNSQPQTSKPPIIKQDYYSAPINSQGDKLKREDIGTFDPSYDDPDDLGVVTEGKNVIFTDVYCFCDRIQSFLEDETTRYSNERQILALFQTLLTGPAVLWWNNELGVAERTNLRQQGLKPLLTKMKERFILDSSIATKRYEEDELTIHDIYRNEHALPQYVQKKLRYARVMGLMGENNINWRGVMSQIRNSMRLELKQFLKPPRSNQTMEEYMQWIEESRGDMQDLAEDIIGRSRATHPKRIVGQTKQSRLSRRITRPIL